MNGWFEEFLRQELTKRLAQTLDDDDRDRADSPEPQVCGIPNGITAIHPTGEAQAVDFGSLAGLSPTCLTDAELFSSNGVDGRSA